VTSVLSVVKIRILGTIEAKAATYLKVNLSW
jgi:hypothetical protein